MEATRCIDITAYIQGYMDAILKGVESTYIPNTPHSKEFEVYAFKAAIEAAKQKYGNQPIYKNALELVINEMMGLLQKEIVVGSRVKPSKTCRQLYGDPDIMTIIAIENGKYLTNTYSILFDEYELELV